MSKELDFKIEDPIIRRNFQILIELISAIEQRLTDIEARLSALEAP
jgi:hypothetical protein